jgi:6-phosphogluconolactonase
MLRDKRGHTFIWYIFSDRKFVLSNDLGNDKVYSYKYNQTQLHSIKSKDSLLLRQEVVHLTFSKNGRYVYVLQELTGGLTVFSSSKESWKVDQTTILRAVLKELSGQIISHENFYMLQTVGKRPISTFEF